MSRFVRIWILLSLAFAAGKLAIDLAVDGALTDHPSGWIAIPAIGAIQAALIAAVTRRRSIAGDRA